MSTSSRVSASQYFLVISASYALDFGGGDEDLEGGEEQPNDVSFRTA